MAITRYDKFVLIQKFLTFDTKQNQIVQKQLISERHWIQTSSHPWKSVKTIHVSPTSKKL